MARTRKVTPYRWTAERGAGVTLWWIAGSPPQPGMDHFQARSLDAEDDEIGRWQAAAEACRDALAEATADLRAAHPGPSRLFWRRLRAQRRWEAELQRYTERTRAAIEAYQPYAEEVQERCGAYERAASERYWQRRMGLQAQFEKWCEDHRTDSRLAGERRWRVVTTGGSRRVDLGGKSEAYAVADRNAELTPQARAAIEEATGADASLWWDRTCDTADNRRALDAAVRALRKAITETAKALSAAGNPNAGWWPGDTTMEHPVSGWTVTFDWSGTTRPAEPGLPEPMKEFFGWHSGTPFGWFPDDALLTVNGKLAEQLTAYPGNWYLRDRRRWYETPPAEYVDRELNANLSCHDLSEFKTKCEIPVTQLMAPAIYVPYLESVAAVMSAGFRRVAKKNGVR